VKQSVQNKIDEITRLARTQQLAGSICYVKDSNREDSLSKVIRNQEDANQFMADLEAAIKLSQNK
jgi:hypothetical protein